jgi:hypothetical protein
VPGVPGNYKIFFQENQETNFKQSAGVPGVPGNYKLFFPGNPKPFFN